MRDDRVKSSVVLDLTQVTVMLDRYQRVVPEDFRRECAIVAAQRFRFEGRCVTLEEHLDNIENRTLARTSWPVQNQELLDLLRVA